MRALITRTPDLLKASMPESDAVRPWLHQTEDDAWKAFDARNWVYQTWAYDAHDVGTTPGFGGDYAKALGSIRARTSGSFSRATRMISRALGAAASPPKPPCSTITLMA